MGLITSRFNLESLHSGRRRSHQGEDTLYSYSLNKNYFSNYFFMGGERFEVSDPDYLFGDSCDLNFLTCTKPYSLPYKKAQQNLLTNLNTKQKAINKVSSRVGGLNSPLNILTGRHRQISQSRKQDAQTQTLTNNKSASNGPEPSQPLVMLINIRKETLRLVKSSNMNNPDSDQNSLTKTAPISNTTSESVCERTTADYSTHSHLEGQQSSSNTHRNTHRHKHSKVTSIDKYSTISSHATNTTIHPQDLKRVDTIEGESIELERTVYGSKNYHDSESSSITSNTLSSAHSSSTTSSTGKSGYTSVRDVPPSDCASDENDECFEDALNEPANLSVRDYDDNDSDKNQQKSLLRDAKHSTKASSDIKITILDDDDEEDEEDDDEDNYEDNDGAERNTSDIENDPTISGSDMNVRGRLKSKYSSGARSMVPSQSRNRKKIILDKKLSSERLNSNRVYNIEFYFDADVDCSIRVSYFCSREVNSNDVTYKSQHATYKSKTYTYKRGLNQKFEQQEHTFQPYLFDEDLLIYKPLDIDGNYNSGAVFPIVIHCVALEGPTPRQSQSLVATVEKSQLDDSYSIKPLKQLIFVDGVQYILQDIYGIENKPLTSAAPGTRSSSSTNRIPKPNRNLRSSCGSLYSLSNLGSNMNLSDSASIGSVADTSVDCANRNRGSVISNQFRSLGSENTFECVICMSEERDTMLLPCRHMCLCSSCAQSLRYQSSSCPICRCPFKAALNLRFMQRNNRSRSSLTVQNEDHNCSRTTVTSNATTTVPDTLVKSSNNSKKREQETTTTTTTVTRRESLTNAATPLLARPKGSSDEKEIGSVTSAADAQVTASRRVEQRFFTNSRSPAIRAADDVDGPMAVSSRLAASSCGGTAIEVHNTNTDSVACESASLEMKPMRWNLGSSSGVGGADGKSSSAASCAIEGSGNNKCLPPQAEES